MLATCEHPGIEFRQTFFPGTFMGRGKPAWEPMTIEDGEFVLISLKNAVSNLERCLMNMQKLNVENIPMRLTPLLSKHLPYVAGFAEEAGGKVERVHIERRVTSRSVEQQQQDKYQRQSTKKTRKPVK